MAVLLAEHSSSDQRPLRWNRIPRKLQHYRCASLLLHRGGHYRSEAPHTVGMGSQLCCTCGLVSEICSACALGSQLSTYLRGMFEDFFGHSTFYIGRIDRSHYRFAERDLLLEKAMPIWWCQEALSLLAGGVGHGCVGILAPSIGLADDEANARFQKRREAV